MKRLLCILMATICISLVGCGTNSVPKPRLEISNGEYVCTAEEFVNLLNEGIAGTTGANFTPREIPSTEGKTPSFGSYSLVVVPKGLILEIKVADSGNVTGAHLEWVNTSTAQNNASIITFNLINMLMPSEADEIWDDLVVAIEDEVIYSKECDGSKIYFFGQSSAKYYLDFDVADS